MKNGPVYSYIRGETEKPEDLSAELEEEINKYFADMILMGNFGERPEEIKEISNKKYKENLVIPSEYNGEIIKTIGNGQDAFSSNNYDYARETKTIIIQEGIEKINDNAFKAPYHNIEKISLPTTLKTIGDNAFNIGGVDSGSQLKEIVGLENVTEKIGNSCFEDCSNLDQTITVNAKIVGEYAFRRTNELNSLIIGANVESIGTCAFYNSGIEEVLFSGKGNLQTIGSSCFYGTKITSIVVPESVTTIDYSIFSSCKELVSATTPVLSKGMFDNCTNLINVNITSNILEIPEGCFSMCSSLKEIDLPDTVQVIRNGAFSDTGLTKFEFPTALTIIEHNAFNRCDALTNLNIPNTITTVGYAAFVGEKLIITVSFASERERPAGWDKQWAGYNNEGVKQINYAQ